MFRLSPRGRLKVVAVVSVRLVNTPATLETQGGWFVLEFYTRHQMDPILVRFEMALVTIACFPASPFAG